MPADTITCIYCRKRKPSSREHALQRSLGGDLILLDVCEGCNRGFSPIDQALADNSFVSLMRVGVTPDVAFDVRLGGEHFVTDPISEQTMEVAVRNGMRSEPHPQIHVQFDDAGVANVSVNAKDRADFDRLAGYVEEKIATRKLRSMHVKIGPLRAGSTLRLVMHRQDDGFIRGQSHAEVEQFLGFLEAHWPQVVSNYRARFAGMDPPQTREIRTPTVQLNLKINFNQVYRAVAKIAFNVMAAKLGADFAFRPEFDAIREYIRGEDLRVPQVQPGELAVDNRFVTSVAPGDQPPIPCDDHAVAIFQDARGLMAWVTLYKISHFVVRLSDVGPLEFIPLVHIFSATRSGNKALDLEEIVRRLRERVPTKTA